MTPIKKGLYEFNKDILVEIRKRMGISQSKMAELLEVQANTLSRWETGVNDPDAGALSAIYSLAKEHGIEPPPFFKMRTSPLEVSICSKTINQAIDTLSSYQLLRSYLITQIELIRPESTPGIKIEIRNTAPVSPDWPKIVFTGVGLGLAYTGDIQARSGSRLIPKMSRKTAEKTSDNPATPWQRDSKRENLLKVNYNLIDSIGNSFSFPDNSSDSGQEKEVLFPGQSIVYEMDITSELLPYLQFKVKATVSRRHLFYGEEIFIMPENITKIPALSALSDYNTIDLYGTLESVISSMPKFNDETRLSEVQTFSSILSINIVMIKKTQDDMNIIFRQHKFHWFLAHIRASFIYLERVMAVLKRMKDAIGSKTTDAIAAEASAILALRGEADLLKNETQELMSKFNISEAEIRSHIQEVNRQKEEQLKAVEEVKRKNQELRKQKEEQSKPVLVEQLQDELDLHRPDGMGVGVKESILMVNKYLEDCYNAKMRRVWIVHGKGDGIQQKYVGELLKVHHLVKSFRLADDSRGGDGATQVDFIGWDRCNI